MGEKPDTGPSWRAYEMAITLLEHDTANQWSLFATFFVPQALLLGLALQSLSTDPTRMVYITAGIQPAFAVGVFGLLIAIPTLVTHARSNLIARLRIEQALKLEKTLPATFLQEGGHLMTGHTVHGLRLSWYMRRPWNNTFYLRALVWLWALADATVALGHRPSSSNGNIIGTVVIVVLLVTNTYLVAEWVLRIWRSHSP